MRTPLRVVVMVALLLTAFVTGNATQMQSDTNLAPFRAITADQRVRAATFDRPTNRPLQPNQTRLEDVESMSLPHDAPEYASFIRDLVCQSDLVVVGRATTKQSFLTETGSSIFTDYSFAPEESLRGGAVFRQPTSHTTVEVSLKGGTIQTPNGPIEVRNEQPLDLGDPYLLFLKRIPKTSSFELSGPHFTIGSPAPRLRSRHEVPATLANGDKSTNTVLADLRAAASKCVPGVVFQSSFLPVLSRGTFRS
jgi:hypothetical protein